MCSVHLADSLADKYHKSSLVRVLTLLVSHVLGVSNEPCFRCSSDCPVAVAN